MRLTFLKQAVRLLQKALQGMDLHTQYQCCKQICAYFPTHGLPAKALTALHAIRLIMQVERKAQILHAGKARMKLHARAMMWLPAHIAC